MTPLRRTLLALGLLAAGAVALLLWMLHELEGVTGAA